MAALQFPKDIQTWLLFHNALSQGVVIEDILKYARKSQEQSAGSEDAISEDATELKKVLNQQVHTLHYTLHCMLYSTLRIASYLRVHMCLLQVTEACFAVVTSIYVDWPGSSS
jgi:PHP family Zn ribbon phosphoesterase